MFNSQEKKRIKAALGAKYSPKIIAHLTSRKIVNANGEPFSTASIRKFIGGHQSDDAIEMEIMKLVDRTEKRAEQLKLQRRSKTTKP